MALSDLAIFTDYTRLAMMEALAQQINLFNAASAGTIVLSNSVVNGDYKDEQFWRRISSLVRRRNVYGPDNVLAQRALVQAVDTMVKVAAGTFPVRIDNAWFSWVQSDEKAAGAKVGIQLAEDMLADMLNTGILSGVAAINGQVALVMDKTGASPDTMTFLHMNDTTALLGDRGSEIRAWMMHSTPMYQLRAVGLTNAAQLFTYGTVNVLADPFGTRFIVSDVPGLVQAGAPAIYRTLGLRPNAIQVEQQDTFNFNIDRRNGSENIQSTYQAEWEYMVGINGFTWDKGTGGHSPTDAALGTSANWDLIVTNPKDAAGVMLLTN